MADLAGLLTTLLDGRVRFIVVGGAAAVLHRAPITTLDLDIVHDRAPENVQRLLQSLTELDAKIRDPAGRTLFPSAAHLQGTGQILLRTRMGDLDCLCTLHDGRGFEELLPHTERIVDGEREIWLIDLPTLIDVKTKAGREKDRLVVPILLAELKRRESSGHHGDG